MSSNRINFLMPLAISLLFCAFVAILSSIFVPFNMDEFLPYHTIICHHYKFNALNTFRESCNEYDLNVLNTGFVLPLRTYRYVGSFPSLYYYPIFLIWKSPISARFVGMLFLLAQAFLLGKIFQIKRRYILFFLLMFFPYSYKHIVEIGPISFHTTSIYLVCLLIQKWCTSLKIKFPITIAIVIFLGIWTKLNYFWFFPAILLILAFQIFENRYFLLNKENKILFIKQLAIGCTVLILLSSIILLSTNPNNPMEMPLLTEIRNARYYTLGEIFRGSWLKTRIAKVLLNPLEATERIFLVRPPGVFTYFYDFIVYFFTPIVLIAHFMNKKNTDRKRKLLEPAIYYLGFLITMFMVIRTIDSRYMHHAISAYPFLILSVISAIKCISLRSIFFRCFLIFMIMNIFYFMTFPSQPVEMYEDLSREKVRSILKNELLAEKYFYVIIDWGMYYYQGLYGPDKQGVFYMEPLNEYWQIEKLKELSKNYGRKLLFVYNSRAPSSNLPLINSSFNLSRCNKINPDAIWQILIEKENNEGNNFCS